MVSDIQVWIDSHVVAGQTIVAPWMKSDIERSLRYHLGIVKKGPGGTSTIRQAGAVLAGAEKPVALTRTSINVRPGDTCTMEIMLSDKGLPVGTYRFDCVAK